ncbi:hypothetical protein PFICI_11927 [Pestalotiopsis fici W106-1]|uniref:Xylanolytic transcriptional activator regulatory domain-containing protein n=1 Tax=Pestalotiopsis fici (strain W106-1 / CGMCC3.15140) TaxID=1229662 RepID=W3WRP7_PESFW|nr:uncharacterized protein PFICI_11927 [Pestalotiopsis fici W106-1]ETS76540.1 hypothetical protein PFICI_11927 [Pestalotiopsis fici W106-1]
MRVSDAGATRAVRASAQDAARRRATRSPTQSAHNDNISRRLEASCSVDERLQSVEQPDPPDLSFQDATQVPSEAATTPQYAEADSAMSIVRKIYKLNREHIGDCSTSAIPDGDVDSASSPGFNMHPRVSISTILNCQLPDDLTISSLLEDYFEAVHWFSLVIYEPHFRKQLLAVQHGYASISETSFLLLLSMVLSMAAWYRSSNCSADDVGRWRLLSNELLSVVESRLVQIMDDHSLTAIQCCILLGSHHVYHGRPNLAFSLLGAATKMAHALSLHRCLKHGSPGDIEERKRIWWTIYTWDRFASVFYGRPLTIDDEACDVEMPDVFAESPYFKEGSSQLAPASTVYSPYQIELNKLYVLASPALKMIFGTCRSQAAGHDSDLKYRSLINTVTKKLMDWHNQLPPHLKLNLNRDFKPDEATWATRAHTLQSLALQLTFDNLLIVIYRPLLSQQAEDLSAMSESISQEPHLQELDNDIAHLDGDTSHHSQRHVSEYWWSAAVRTARVTQLTQLTHLATNSHLVAFMAMNLFHSAIVLVLNALSSPLSDKTQGVKRALTRILRLQELVGRRSIFSRQSSAVLKNLIALLLRKESEAMLGVSEVATPQSRYEGTEPWISGHTYDPVLLGEDALQVSQDPTRGSTHPESADILSAPTDSLRLNQSLAAVQRAVFPSLYETQTSQNPGAPYVHEATGPWPASFSGGHEAGVSHNAGGNHSDMQMGENNVFWLWDLPLGGSSLG